jgi:hypothetical protein
LDELICISHSFLFCNPFSIKHNVITIPKPSQKNIDLSPAANGTYAPTRAAGVALLGRKKSSPFSGIGKLKIFPPFYVTELDLALSGKVIPLLH